VEPARPGETHSTPRRDSPEGISPSRPAGISRLRFAAVKAGRGGFYDCALPLLRGVSRLWRLGVRIDRLLTPRRSLPRPVLSVGNLTLGGTGKTPFVMFLARKIAARGLRPAVLTRGYRQSSRSEEEPALIARRVPECRVLVGRDRFRSALESLRGPEPPDVFILDDGFQHWRLERDMDIVLLDAIVPLGLGETVPAGLLREPIDSLDRASFAVITRSDLVSGRKLGILKSYLTARFPALPTALSAERVVAWRDLQGALSDRGPAGPVLAACGIGNPVGFFKRLQSEGVTIAGHAAFPDHFRWDRRSVEEVEREAVRTGAEAIVTTAKDASKIEPGWVHAHWSVMEIETVFTSGEAALETLLSRALERGDARRKEG